MKKFEVSFCLHVKRANSEPVYVVVINALTSLEAIIQAMVQMDMRDDAKMWPIDGIFAREIR